MPIVISWGVVFIVVYSWALGSMKVEVDGKTMHHDHVGSMLDIGRPA